MREKPPVDRLLRGWAIGYVDDAGLFVGAVRGYSGHVYHGCIWPSRENAEGQNYPTNVCQHGHRSPMRAVECIEAAIEQGIVG